VKEKQLLERLQSNWLKRETKIQFQIASRDKEISELAQKIEQVRK
jgi:hypothetical protein